MKRIKDMLRRIGTAGLAAIMLTAQMPVTAFAEEIAEPQAAVGSDEVLPAEVQMEDVLPGESGGGIIEGAASEESGEDIANTSKTGDEAVQAGETPLTEKNASEKTADEESSDPVEKQEEGVDAQEAQESDKKDADGDKKKEEQTASEEEERPAFSESKSIDGVRITVEADEGVFPEGATLSVEKVTLAQEKQAEEAVESERDEDKQVAASYTYDIKVLDQDRNEIQPANDNGEDSSSRVKVSFKLDEVADENLETNVYHITENENETVESNDVSTKSDPDKEEPEESESKSAEADSLNDTDSTVDGESASRESTDGRETTGGVELVAEKLPVETDGDTATAETDGFSLYTVEFTYDNKQYVLPGDSEVALSEVLDTVGLTGEVSDVEVSDESLFSAKKCKASADGNTPEKDEDGKAIEDENGTWFVFAHKAFSTEEWMKVTIGGVVYEIAVTDDVTFSSGSGTEEDPYQITTIADMTALATLANTDSSYVGSATKGKYFKLMNNITYGDSDKFTPIGKVVESTYKYFNGTFDGNGCTISGIRPTESDLCGLFGYVYENGTVKNVTIDNATISGGSGVGGIAGSVMNGGKIENCFVTNSTISGTWNVGAVVGGNSGTLTGNYYINCSVKGDSEAKTSGVGCGDGGGNGINSDLDGARQAYDAAQESLCQKMADKEIYIGGTTEITPVYYDYNDGNTVSISPTVTFNGAALDASKYTVTVKNSSNVDVTGNVIEKGTYTLTVSGVNSEGYYGSASTTIAVGVGLPITAGSTKLTSGTYAVNETLTISERIKIDGDVKLILGADKTLTASKGIDVDTGNSLTIEGEGTLIATGEENNSGIGGSLSGSTYRVSGTITINDSTVTATGGAYAAGIGGSCSDTNHKGACNNGTVIINGGIVTATGGIRAPGIGGGAGNSRNGGDGGIITINGGQVTANAGLYEGSYTSCGMGPGGVYQSGNIEGAAATITLGWTDSANDFIQATSYKTASFATGKVFVLENTDTVATESNWSGQKLVPYVEPVTNIDSAVISGVDALYPYSESGVSITPIVTLLEKHLTKGTDYTVGYELNGNAVNTVKDIGTYTLTVSGTGNYSGSVNTTFRVVHAKTVINYQAYEGGELKDKTLAADGYTSVTNETTAMTGGWYVVQDDFTVPDRISVTGDVNLVLCDGATLTAGKGIGVTDGNSLTVYSQSGNTGGITAANSENYYAGIGGNRNGAFNSAVKSGSITIHGGVINATGAFGSAGIGAAYGGSAGAIAIYGGKVTATGGGTGIGGSGATIYLGWCRSEEDYIEAKGYEGSVTFDKVYLLDGTSTTATAENCGGKKIVPNTMNTCKVTFDSNGGSSIASQIIVEGQAVAEPVKPIKQGYELVGWYTAKNFSGSAYDFSSAVNADLTLYARWETNDAISYIGAEEQTVSNFTEYTKMESGYTSLPEGTYFVGEYTAVSSRITIDGTVNLILGDGKALTAESGINVPGGTTLNIFSQSAGTGKLTANADYHNAGIGGNRNQNSGTVRIYGGIVTSTGGITGAGIGGGNDGSNGAVYIYGGTVTANGGVDDSGHGYSAAIGGGQLGDGGIISILGGKVTANGGSNNISTGIGYQMYSTNKTATITLGYKTANDFIQAKEYLGTVTVESGKKFVTDDETPVSVSDTVNDLTTINGKKLTPKKYTVTFDSNYTGDTDETKEVAYNTPATAPTVPTRTGYTFKEWQLNGTAYDFSTLVTGDITLTAVWTANAYKVYFNGNGATSGSMSDQSFTYDTAQNLTANGFVRIGYKFMGWSDTVDGSKQYDNGASVSNLSAVDGATINLYAVWQEKAAINPVVTFTGWTYGETAYEPGVTAESNPGSGTPTYEYFTDAACTVKTSVANSGADSAGGVPKNAGTYYIKATVPETDDYKAGTGSTGFTIAKAAINTQAINTPTAAANLTYTGSAQALITAGSCEFGEMQYALGTETGATQPYTTTIPTATNAGTYYVWYKVVGDANHNDVAAQSITVIIGKAQSGTAWTRTVEVQKGNNIEASVSILGFVGTNASLVGNPTVDSTTGSVAASDFAISSDKKSMTFKVTSVEGGEGNVTATLSSDNYESFTLKIPVQVKAKTTEVKLEYGQGVESSVQSIEVSGLDALTNTLNGTSVKVELELKLESEPSDGTVNEKIENDVAQIFSGVERGSVKKEYLDISVKQTVDSTESTVADVGRVIEIAVKFDLTGKYNPVVVREHGGSVARFTALALKPGSGYTDGTYYVDNTHGTIYIYTRYFSTYTIAYATVNSYMVSFDAQGGSSVQDIVVTAGGNISTLPTSTRSGYSFDGWFTSSSGGNQLTTSTTINENVTYYAHWTQSGGGGGETPTPEPTPDPTPDPTPTPTPDPEPVNEKETKTVKATATYKKEKITVSANMSWDSEITYTGSKIKPSDLGYELDLSELYDEVKIKKGNYEPKDLFKVTYVHKNNLHKSTAKKKTSLYAKIKLNEKTAKKAGLTKNEIARLKAIVKALNKQLKKSPCVYTIDPVELDAAGVEIVADVTWTKKGKIKKAKSIRVTTYVNGEKKTFKLKSGQYKISVKDASAKTVKITGKKDFTGTVIVNSK